MKERKPLHWFAIVLWAVAAAYILIMSPASWFLYRNAAEFAQDAHSAALQAKLANAAWNLFEGGLVTSLELASAGFLIELLDAVRWNLTAVNERAGRGASGDPPPAPTGAPTT